MSGSYVYNPSMWPAIIAVSLLIFLGLYSWRRRSVPGAKPFAIGCLFAAFWALGALLEISAVDFSTQVFWIKFQVVWQLPSITALMCFVIEFTMLGRWLSRRNLIFLAIPPAIFLGFIITNDNHHLVWVDFQKAAYAIPLPSILNRIFLGYGYILGLIGTIVLLWLAIRSPQHRWPVGIILTGQVISRGMFLLDYVKGGFLGPGESVLIFLGVISAMYAVALFRFHVLDPVSVARKEVLEQMREGMLVLDLQGRIIDLNPSAARILRNSITNLRRKTATEVLSDKIDLSDKARQAPIEFSLEQNKLLRHYNLEVTALKDKRDNMFGHLLLLHDITEEKRAQSKILEQQQAVAMLQERESLARELHDSTGQVLGYVNLQVETIRKWLQEGNQEKADSLLIRLAEVAKEAHTDIRESILSLKAGSAQGWSFLPSLRQYLNDFQSHYGIRSELVIKDGLERGCFKPDVEVQLLRVIQESMTNARKHSGAHIIRIVLERNEIWGHVTITDDGCGFDPGQLKQENDRHFGLVFMNERMKQIGGFMKIESQCGAGTVIKLEAPIRDQ
jgi:signal transduction histidine kinase